MTAESGVRAEASIPTEELRMNRKSTSQKKRSWAWLALVVVVFFSVSSTRHFAICGLLHPGLSTTATAVCCQTESSLHRPTCHPAPEEPTSDDADTPPMPCQCQMEAPPLHTTKTTMVFGSGDDPLISTTTDGFPAQQLLSVGHQTMHVPLCPLPHPLNSFLRSVILLI